MAVLGPVSMTLAAEDILAERRRAWMLRVQRRYAPEEVTPDATESGWKLSAEEVARRQVLLAGARRGDPEAKRELWTRYRCRVIVPSGPARPLAV